MHNFCNDFPILSNTNERFIYFDNAATTHKPASVIEAEANFYRSDYATVNRSMYSLAEKATQKFENVRAHAARFIGADPTEIVFTKGTTEGINFVATGWGMQNINAGDEIVLTELEHHSNLLPYG